MWAVTRSLRQGVSPAGDVGMHVADDVVTEAPVGPVEGLAAVREFLTPFSMSVSKTHLLAMIAT